HLTEPLAHLLTDDADEAVGLVEADHVLQGPCEVTNQGPQEDVAVQRHLREHLGWCSVRQAVLAPLPGAISPVFARATRDRSRGARASLGFVQSSASSRLRSKPRSSSPPTSIIGTDPVGTPACLALACSSAAAPRPASTSLAM